MFNWYFDNTLSYNNGPDYYLQTIEVDDTGATQKLQVGTSVIIAEGVEFKTVTYEITYKAQDKLLFGRLINYSDPSPGVFTSGDLLHTTIENKY